MVSVAIVAAAGVAYAAKSGGGAGSLTLCAAHKSGALSLGKKGKCPKGARVLTIDKQGPAGLPGKDGTPADLAPGPVHYLAESAPGAIECKLTPGVFCGIGESHWSNDGGSAAPVGFQKDAAGFVHLQGTIVVKGSGPPTHEMFYLPAGYRPADGDVNIVAVRCNGEIEKLEIHADGQIWAFYAAENFCVGLDGVTFRAA